MGIEPAIAERTRVSSRCASGVMDQSASAATLAAIALGLLASAGVTADERVDEILDVQQGATAAERKTQVEVDELADETQDAVGDYRLRLHELDGTRRYNDNLERTIADQDREKASLARQIDDFGDLERGLVPLLMDMVDDLERFVSIDMPFRLDQRLATTKRLRELMDRADVTIAEKYRQVMASYQDGVAIGRNTESYSGELEIAGATRTVDFLRVGRVLLAYQTMDREETGYWDTRTRQWRTLDSSYRRPVTLGIRIARSLAPPDILALPVAAPREPE
ncbi:MAG: DUF3450 domain-containing protein [Gammaproteobacteria bacterium]|nr:DUF3450 domain-containing protein [Gammaproteobacteria bacterium]